MSPCDHIRRNIWVFRFAYIINGIAVAFTVVPVYSDLLKIGKYMHILYSMILF